MHVHSHTQSPQSNYPITPDKNTNQIYAGDLFVKILDLSKLELINNTVISNYLKTYPTYRCSETKTIKNKDGSFDFCEGDTIFCVINRGELSHSPAQKKLLDNVNVFLNYMNANSKRPIYSACLKQIKVNHSSLGNTYTDIPTYRNFLEQTNVANQQLVTGPQIDSTPPHLERMGDRSPIAFKKNTIQLYARDMLTKILTMSKIKSLDTNREISRHLKTYSKYRCIETTTIENTDGIFEFRKGDTIFCVIKRSQLSQVTTKTNLLSNTLTFMNYMKKKAGNKAYGTCLKQIKVNLTPPSFEREVVNSLGREKSGDVYTPNQKPKYKRPKLFIHQYNPKTQNFRPPKEFEDQTSPSDQMQVDDPNLPSNEPFPDCIFQQQDPKKRTLPLVEFDLPTFPEHIEESHEPFPNLNFRHSHLNDKSRPIPQLEPLRSHAEDKEDNLQLTPHKPSLPDVIFQQQDRFKRTLPLPFSVDNVHI